MATAKKKTKKKPVVKTLKKSKSVKSKPIKSKSALAAKPVARTAANNGFKWEKQFHLN